MDELFGKVLSKFDHVVIDGKIIPTLVEGTIADLFTFIIVEEAKIKIKNWCTLCKNEKCLDPNEHDPGSAADQEAML